MQGQDAGPLFLGQAEEGPLLQLQHRTDSASGQGLAGFRQMDVLVAPRAAGQAEMPLLFQLLQRGVDRLLAQREIAAQLCLSERLAGRFQGVQNPKSGIRQSEMLGQPVIQIVLLLIQAVVFLIELLKIHGGSSQQKSPKSDLCHCSLISDLCQGVKEKFTNY